MNLRSPALENDGVVLNFTYEVDRFSPRNDQDFSKMLQQFVSKNNFKLVMTTEILSKAFSEWSFPKLCQLYGLSESDDPSLSVFPPFTCDGNKASKSQYVCSYLVIGVNLYEVKDEDFYKGIAQNAVQLESALSNCKRKASEMEEGDVFMGKTFGIITDAEKWYFI
ncbi:hypothetical protein C1645_813056 [Glomus cerebriforme]|uniref:Uncharacterized protein n=1 Tax=Glomus cerebriforme TaxID=658196 RepID=A0A397TNZ0_9GLOM|nr:hypothetical protein C1645_813056 [Glomus cerebriforme]